jgi:primosomal protein N' (replication factor Y)
MAVARVIIDLALDKAFDYLVPPALAGALRIGDQVRVPFGSSEREGFVLALADSSDFPKLKPITGLADGRASLPEKLIELGSWMAEYYCCSREQAIRTLLPGAVRHGKVKFKLEKYFFTPDPERCRAFIAENTGKKTSAGRISLLQTLLDSGESPLAELVALSGASRASLKTLERDGLVATAERAVRRDPFAGREIIAAKPLPPSPEQSAALDLIEQMLDGRESRRVLLLRGVTNSGKTEVYLQAIARTLALGKSAIVLVPEISLTPQTVRRFHARFGDQLSVMHSQLTPGERFDEWHRISRNEASIVVGARSALFAPFRNLGLIVVDEEHETSYKQSEAPRYSARDVAVMRGKLENAVVILGSATPSAESSRNAESGKYVLSELKSQVGNRRQPLIRIVDQRLSGPPEKGKSNFFSKLLIDAVRERLERGEQSILFLNRRGYARIMLCEQCGFEAYCPDCSVPYIYSKKNQSLTCHLCGASIPAPERCPDCGSAEIRYQGVGTEKIEAAATAVFHSARIARMDSDSMRGAADYEQVLGLFRQGKIDILIGTQMIAKGLHFPNVTLVGLINADSGLLIPDFRAPERTFQLITQVAGRAGRGDERGEVIIQTYNPDNETIRFAANQDFDGFRRYDLEVRQLLGYPPFGYLIAIHFRGEDENQVAAFAEKFTNALRPYCAEPCRVSGPGPAPIDRIKAKYRYMTILRGPRLGPARQALREMIVRGATPRGVEVYADVDAQSLL